MPFCSASELTPRNENAVALALFPVEKLMVGGNGLHRNRNVFQGFGTPLCSDDDFFHFRFGSVARSSCGIRRLGMSAASAQQHDDTDARCKRTANSTST